MGFKRIIGDEMGHYFTNEKDLKSVIKEVKMVINQTEYKFMTDHGVFSKSGLDFGTRTLLENIENAHIKGKVLDFGCGYGPIGIYLKKNYDCEVDMIDINERSINLAQKNALLNNVSVKIYLSDTYMNVKDKYDFIVTNPPIRVGKKKLYEILFRAKEYLNPNGELWLVVSKDQGAKTLVKDLGESYLTSVIDKNKGFYVIRAINN